MQSIPLLFLCWGVPWPPHSGADLRTMGLLEQLSKFCTIELFTLSQEPLSEEATFHVSNYCSSIYWCRMQKRSPWVCLVLLLDMFCSWSPFHCCLIRRNVLRDPEALRKLRDFRGVVYANYGHWGTLVRLHMAPNWIIDQQNSDIDFWRVYIGQTSNPLRKMMAYANWRLARSFFPDVYKNVGAVISVCREDKMLTRKVAPAAQVEVIENGVDCSFFSPNRKTNWDNVRLLYTGTSAIQNIRPLKYFVKRLFPAIRRELPDAEFVIGGRFSRRWHQEFASYDGVRLTGEILDMRPIYDSSDIFVAPFHDSNGSKLKIAQAMAMAMPIVSTPQGIRGFALHHESSVLIAENDDDFVRSVVRLAKDPVLRERLGQEARRIAVTTIDWNVLGHRLRDILKNCLIQTDCCQ